MGSKRRAEQNGLPPPGMRKIPHMASLGATWRFSRPFTLVPPMVGIFSGALIGYGASHAPFSVPRVFLAVIAAAALNAASNGLNQICDLENDLVNKPHRPLPAGEISGWQAAAFVAVMYLLALALVAAVNLQTFAIYLIAALATVAYSAPPLRLKRHFLASNFTIAVVRGGLLKVAGWSAIATVLKSAEPWYIGLIYFVFLLGATTTKDFVDIEGDRTASCYTLPVKYGAAASAKIISPSFVLPWLLMAAGAGFKVLSGNAVAIYMVSAALTAWGAYVIYLMNRDPARLVAEGENHPSWRHMYWMMMAGHLGLAAAYLIR
jgi:4-hydroxybenzoate polyprenyltransferase